MDNCFTIAGRVAKLSATRYSPAGIPISRFVLEHHSEQREAGIARQARCRIVVIAAGAALQASVAELATGVTARVMGFISRSDYRQGDTRLVLHAERIERLEQPSEG
ncbi:MAG: primosomal replication protein N [Gammaproteobacteria bacterium]